MQLLWFIIALLVVMPVKAQSSPISNARQLTFEGLRAGEDYFSADGRRMIFQSERIDTNPFYQIYLLDMETGEGIVKDGPAERAGLAGDDIIVRLAGEDLANIYDYVRTLNGLKPGREVELAIERKSKRMTLKIVPSVRD